MKKFLVLVLFIMAVIGASHYFNSSPIPQFSDEMMEIICLEEGI